MAFDHLSNANNGNAIKKIASGESRFSGRISGLTIYKVNLSELKKVVGDTLQEVINSMNPDNDKDLANGYRQPTDHDDRLGNLPVAPGLGVTYREYYVPANSLPKPAYLRLVADLSNRRLYITPTHYDVWLCDRDSVKGLGKDEPVAHDHDGAQNPFFLVVMGA